MKPTAIEGGIYKLSTHIIIFALICAYTLVISHLLSDNTGKGYLYLLMLIQVTPFLINLPTGNFRFISLIMFTTFVTYSMGKFNQHFIISPTEYLPESVILAIKVLIVCTLLTFISYAIMRALLPLRSKFVTPSLLNLGRFEAFLLFAFVISKHAINPYVPQAVGNLYHVAIVLLSILLLCSKIRGMPVGQNLLKIGIGISGLLTFLETGALGTLGYYGATLFLIACLYRKLRYLPVLALFVIILCALQTVKNDYRIFILASAERPASLSEKFDVLRTLLYETYVSRDAELHALAGEEAPLPAEKEQAGVFATLASGFNRTGNDSMARVLSWTPDRVPYWHGETYKNIPFIFIPRFLWPGKPKWNHWNKFGRKYGFLSYTDRQTSVSIPYLAEAYMNFGYVGIFIAALLFGLLVVASETLCHHYLPKSNLFVHICFITPCLSGFVSAGPLLHSFAIIIISLFMAKPLIRRLTQMPTPSPA